MADRMEEALRGWEGKLEAEAEKLKGEDLSNEVEVARRKLEVLKALKGSVRGDKYGEKVWEEEVKEFEQRLEEKQMRQGRLYLLKKLIDRLEDIL